MRGIAAILFTVLAGQAVAQDWPQRPLRMLVGFGAGGGTDILARIVAPTMGTALGQPVVIENRPGAGGSIAANVVAKSAPDGYTAFLLNNGHAVSAVMISPLPYEPVADFEPVSMVATMPLVILAGPRAGFGHSQHFIRRHVGGDARRGIGAKRAVAAIVAAEMREGNEHLLRVGDDPPLIPISRGGREAQELPQIGMLDQVQRLHT